MYAGDIQIKSLLRVCGIYHSQQQRLVISAERGQGNSD